MFHAGFDGVEWRVFGSAGSGILGVLWCFSWDLMGFSWDVPVRVCSGKPVRNMICLNDVAFPHLFLMLVYP